MRILLTRPEADARRSAQQLKTLGHAAIIAPLFEIAPTGAAMPDAPFDCVLATSAHAFDTLAQAPDALKHAPLHVVGERTAGAARASGFTHIASAAPDAKALAIALARELAQPQAFLYLAGRERRPELEASLAALGHAVAVWTLYETRETEANALRLAQIWRDGQVDAVLHFSLRSAALYVALARRAGLVDAALAPIQAAISPRAAESLTGARDLRVAPSPDLDGLIACL